MQTENTTRKSFIGSASILLIAAGLPLAIGTPLASAQDALGDGRALDANLRQGTGGRNDPERNFAREFAFRNAIVTGNAPGGMSFRGELGYTAADDFRADLGSTDIFNFERDSFYSSLATRNLGGIDPLRSSLSWSIAGQRDGIFGDLIVSRPGAGATAAEALGRTTPGIDVFSSIQGTMRSPSSMLLDAELRPQLLGYSQDDQSGQVSMLTASSLLGVRTLPPISPVFGRRSIAEEDARLEFHQALPPVDRLLARPTEDTETQEEVSRPTQVVPERATATARESIDVSTFNRLVDSLRTESNAVRATRAGEGVLIPETEREEAIDPGAPQDPTDLFTPPTTPTDPLAPMDDLDTEEIDPRSPDYYDRSIERLRSALRLPDLPMPQRAPMTDGEGESIPTVSTLHLVDELVRDLISTNLPIVETLTPPPTSSATFRNHIRSGVDHLRAGEWFAAEERFTAALSIEQGDPSAAIGRVNAQLGGGMYLSAALNLRDLLRAYPELLAVRFDASLLPDQDRANRIRAQLRQRAETDRPLARDAGLLLAYLGHQTNTKQDIIDGFAIIERVEEALEINPDPVHIAAKAAWMRTSDDAQPTRPTETPAP